MPHANIMRSLVAGIMTDFKDMWRQKVVPYREQQQWLFFPLPTPKGSPRNATWVWKDAVPFPSAWAYNSPRQISAFRDRFMTLGLHPFQLTMEWNDFDAYDDQVGDLLTHVQFGVNRFQELPIALGMEYFNGTALLNRELLLAYDGADLFSATDGAGADRLGVSGGNIVVGTGITPEAILHDFAVVQQRAQSAVDPTAGRPIFNPEDTKFENMFAIVPITLNEVFQKAANSEMLRISSQNTTPESNWLKGKFQWETNALLTDTNNWFVVIRHPYWKPLAYREPNEVKTILADMSNSDYARENGRNRMHHHIRTDMGPFMPATIYKVSN